MWACTRSACQWNNSDTFWHAVSHREAVDPTLSNLHLRSHLAHVLDDLLRVEARMVEEDGVTIADMATIESLVQGERHG